MKPIVDLLGLLQGPDWLALLCFFGGWIAYAVFAKRRSQHQPSILGSSNHERRRWMLRTTYRENRVVDGVVVQNLTSSPSFFASTTILIIGGLLAVMSTAERAEEMVRELPFTAHTAPALFYLKLAVLTGVFIYAFFRFTWSVRQYSLGVLLVAAAPLHDEAWSPAEREGFADRAGGVMGLAAEAFNDGLRAYYLAFAALAWFFSPWACWLATLGVLWVLYRREFHSDVLRLLAR